MRLSLHTLPLVNILMRLLQVALCVLAGSYCLSTPVHAQGEPGRTKVMILELSGSATGTATLDSKSHLGVQSQSAERSGQETVVSLPATLHLSQGDSVVVTSQAPVTVSALPSRTVTIRANRLVIAWSANVAEPTICVKP